MKLLTITIPCYNSEKYMHKCIESLLPGGEDVEILIVDDGSTDGTAAIADEYALKYPSIIRVIHPHVLLPATTALGTIHPKGRELGILAGANVVMPNLSPVAVREKYKLYDNKICTGDEAAECRFCMQKRMESIGYQVAVNRGDFQP